MFRGRTRIMAVALVVGAAAPTLANIDLEWRPLAQTVNVGDSLGVGLYAVAENEPGESFSAAQVILSWDPAYLQLTGVSQAGAIDLMGSAFLYGDSFGINEANPPADGDAMWVGMVTLGQERPVTPAGTLLTTVLFSALAETAGTPVGLLPSATHPPHPTGYSKILNLQSANLLGTLGPASVVTIVPEPATLLLCAAGLALLRVRRRR